MTTKKILCFSNDVESELDFYMHEDPITDEIEKKFDRIVSKVLKKKHELKVRDYDTDMLCVQGALVERKKGITDKAWREEIDMYCFQFDDDFDVHIVEVE